MTDIIYKKMSHSFLVWSSKNIDEPEYSYGQQMTCHKVKKKNHTLTSNVLTQSWVILEFFQKVILIISIKWQN